VLVLIAVMAGAGAVSAVVSIAATIVIPVEIA